MPHPRDHVQLDRTEARSECRTDRIFRQARLQSRCARIPQSRGKPGLCAPSHRRAREYDDRDAAATGRCPHR